MSNPSTKDCTKDEWLQVEIEAVYQKHSREQQWAGELRERSLRVLGYKVYRSLLEVPSAPASPGPRWEHFSCPAACQMESRWGWVF